MVVEFDNDKEKTIYNYNELLDEYIMQSDDEVKLNSTYREKGEYETGFITYAKWEVSLRLWGFIKIWLLVYLVFAIPLWCTRGWCCCCLICKFCKPLKTIKDAKKYLHAYPPGIFIINERVIHYEPTEREKEYYEEFEHLIRTL